jgi:hypothetical protein
MTCEVAVMNKHGIALAADSAVTLGAGEKIYHGAEKLFSLSASIPIGVMTYGNANLMGVPWEIVIKSYGRQLGGQNFERVEQCALDFLRFIETNNVFFPASLQERKFRDTVGWYWYGQFVRPLEMTDVGEDRLRKLADLLKNDLDDWKRLQPMHGLGTGYGDKVIADYAKALDALENELFTQNERCGRLQLLPEIRRDLRAVTREMFTQLWFHPADLSGIVFAGLGEAELFPACHEYHVGTIAAGKLRFNKRNDIYVDHDMTACVAPFGQIDTINMFYRGIDAALHEKMINAAADYVSRADPKADRQKIFSELFELLQREIDQQYRQPLMAAVDGLPRHDLARMAEALVSLTALRARVSAREKETVAGPIDVAVLSKGEGFVWIRHKDNIRPARVAPEFIIP